jgi:UDP-N-acetylglucosamine 2-epimerase (hydrolysing)
MKKLLFLTGTRADYGKLKPLIKVSHSVDQVDSRVAVTGMHALSSYGSTWREVSRDFPDAYIFLNQNDLDTPATILAKTVSRLEDLFREIEPDLLVVHGDRLEALAAAATGAFMNIRVGHIEGGEVSGTVDESIRHAVSKLAHVHFVSNAKAATRLHKLGETSETVFVIGSPELDVADSPDLPTLEETLAAYGIPDRDYAIFVFHPVTTDVERSARQADMTIHALQSKGLHTVIIEPNNDLGSDYIRQQLASVRENSRFSIFPSVRYERFLVLLRNAQFVIGNSSLGVREAPHYGVPSVNIGDRQLGRATAPTIVNVHPESPREVSDAIDLASTLPRIPSYEFGDGKSAERFADILASGAIWSIPIQKRFFDD